MSRERASRGGGFFSGFFAGSIVSSVAAAAALVYAPDAAFETGEQVAVITPDVVAPDPATDVVPEAEGAEAPVVDASTDIAIGGGEADSDPPLVVPDAESASAGDEPAPLTATPDEDDAEVATDPAAQPETDMAASADLVPSEDGGAGDVLQIGSGEDAPALPDAPAVTAEDPVASDALPEAETGATDVADTSADTRPSSEVADAPSVTASEDTTPGVADTADRPQSSTEIASGIAVDGAVEEEVAALAITPQPERPAREMKVATAPSTPSVPTTPDVATTPAAPLEEEAEAEAPAQEEPAIAVVTLPEEDAPVEEADEGAVELPVVSAPDEAEEVAPEEEVASEEAAPEGEELDNPVIGPAFEIFAQPFAGPTDTPLLAIILEDVGTDGIERSELLGMGLAVTFGVSPSEAEAGAVERAYRDAGFEVVATIPRDGPYHIGQNSDPAALPETVARYRETVPGAVAIVDAAEGDLFRNSRVVAALAGVANDTGHGVLIHERFGTNRAIDALRGAEIPSASVLRVIDVDRDEASIRRNLDRATLDASKTGAAVVYGRTYPETLSALSLWALSSGSRSVVLAPLTATVQKQTGR